MSQPGQLSILVIRTDSIGDHVMFGGVLTRLKTHLPHCKITMLCWDIVASLYEGTTIVDEIIGFDRDKALTDSAYLAGLVEKVKARSDDIVINPLAASEVLTHVLTLSSSAKMKVGFSGTTNNISAADKEVCEKQYTNLLPLPREPFNHIGVNQVVLDAFGAPIGGLSSYVAISEAADNKANEIYTSSNLDPTKTLIFFGTPKYDYKRYSKFGEVLRDVTSQNNLSIVAVGAKKDIEYHNQLLSSVAGQKTLNVSGQLTLLETAAVMSKAKISLGVDTSLGHIATGVNLRNILLFGGGHFGAFCAYSPISTTIVKSMPCFGCNWSCHYQTFPCISEISPALVTKVFNQTLNSSTIPARSKIFVEGRQGDDLKWLSRFVNRDKVELVLAHA